MRIPEDLELELLMRYDIRFAGMLLSRYGLGYEYNGQNYMFLNIDDDPHFPIELVTYRNDEYRVLDYIFFDDLNNNDKLSYIIDNAVRLHQAQWRPAFVDKHGIKFSVGKGMKFFHKIKKLLRGITE